MEYDLIEEDKYFQSMSLDKLEKKIAQEIISLIQTANMPEEISSKDAIWFYRHQIIQLIKDKYEC